MKSEKYLATPVLRASIIAVRALAYCAEDHCSRAKGWALAHCPPSREWAPGGNTVEIKAARKGAGHSTSHNRWPRTSVPSNRHFPNVRVVYGTYLYRAPSQLAFSV